MRAGGISFQDILLVFERRESRRRVGPRRVVAKVDFHFGELFPRVGFIVTNVETGSRAVVRFLQQGGDGGAMDQGRKQAVEMARLSCHRSRSKEVRLH